MQSLQLCFDPSQIAILAERYPKRYAVQDSKVCEVGGSARSRGHLIKAEFVAIAKWKSPRPAKSYEGNSEGEVVEATKLALASTHDLERIVQLTALKGVRVRTASAILHVSHHEPCPLIDVWAMTAWGVPREETEKWDELDWLRAYPAYARCCRELAERTGLSPRLIDKALWVYGEDAGSRRKRKTSE